MHLLSSTVFRAFWVRPVKRSDIACRDCPKRRGFLRRERIGQISWTRQWTGVSARGRDLKLMVKQMLNSDIGQRLNLKQCIRGSVFQDVNRLMAILPIAIAECPSMQCFRSRSQQTGTQQTRMQASVDLPLRPSPFVLIANVASS
jgi:hypothetical protein